MSRIKILVPEDIELETNDTFVSGCYPGEAEAELDAFINSIEGRLAGFTTQELSDEIWHRNFLPYRTAIQNLKDTVDKLSTF